jgi:diguanylate cyclase (GGDEF)-like protein/PAS domain S-box-containing protein
MTEPSSRRRWGPRLRQRLMVGAVGVVTVATVGLVAVNAVALGEVSDQVQNAQSRAASLGNAMRESLLLLQLVTALGETSTLDEVATHRGLLGRQFDVSAASYPPDAPEVREIAAIKAAVARFPWQRLPRVGGHDDPLRLSAMALTRQVEQRVNALRSAEEKRFYSATIEALDAKLRSQVGLGVLIALVLGLGSAAVLMITRRSRSDTARAYEALRASEGRFRSLVQRASDLTVVTDRAGVVSYISPAAEALLGVPPDDLLDQPLLAHVEQGQRAAVADAVAFLAEQPGLVHTIELHLRTPDGRIRLVEAVCQNLLDDADVGGLVWNGRDVTDRRTLEDELMRQALHDPLTGLPNRALLLRRLGELMGGSGVSVLLIDLDGFKNVNDTLGHPAGDELLRTAAQRLLGCVRDGDTAARLGGDEFAVIVPAGRPQQAAAVGARIVDVLRSPFTVSGREVRVSASIGMAHGSDGADDLLRDADIAMYVAKNSGKGRLVVFQPDMRTSATERTDLQQQLAKAVDLGEIEVHYQPIVDLVTLQTTALEALARWRRPDGSLMSPAVFIPIAEESGAIHDVGRDVLRQACRAAVHWRRTLPGRSGMSISVNVSVHQVLSGHLVDDVVAALADSGLPAADLTLEIVESTALEDADRAGAELARLQRAGVRIAVDDFGSGYSSLGFLMGLAVDTLKIDRTLLEFDTTRQGVLVNAVAELGRTLGLTVVVEGVETTQHLLRAREALCDAAQGYHFAPPMRFEDVAAFLSGEAGQVRAAVDAGAADA